MRFVKEDGHWKIKDEVFSEKAYPAESVCAVIPPAAGAFERAGAPWQNVAPAFDKADAAKYGWQVRATYDESFLYIRIESPAPMPAPGSQAEKPPMGWPAMKVGVSGVGEFVLHATANIGDQATFDESGRANQSSALRGVLAYVGARRPDDLPGVGGLKSRSVGSGRRPLPRRACSAADDGRRGREAHENHDRRRAVAEERDFQP